MSAGDWLTTPVPGLQIPIDQLEDGRIYKVRSRNLVVGVWRAQTRSFIGIREKFKVRFLFEEFHYDNGPPLGTAWAVAASTIVTTVPERYWDAAKGDDLRSMLMPLHLGVLEESSAAWDVELRKAESLRWRPQTLAEHRRQEALEVVRQWRRDQLATVPGVERKADLMKKLHAEYVERIETAIKENPVD